MPDDIRADSKVTNGKILALSCSCDVFMRLHCYLFLHIPTLQVGLQYQTVHLYPFQLHSLSISLFASLIAPFGGFFASGFKRAFKIKVSIADIDQCVSTLLMRVVKQIELRRKSIRLQNLRLHSAEVNCINVAANKRSHSFFCVLVRFVITTFF